MYLVTAVLPTPRNEAPVWQDRCPRVSPGTPAWPSLARSSATTTLSATSPFDQHDHARLGLVTRFCCSPSVFARSGVHHIGDELFNMLLLHPEAQGGTDAVRGIRAHGVDR